MKCLATLKYCLLITGGMLLLMSCKDYGINESLNVSTEPPGPVHNVSVDPLPGGAKITYSLPDDQDLLYVKAEYTLTTGTEREVKASYYNNSLLIEGYADTLEHEIKLYAVNRGELASEPVNVTIKPKRSTIWDVFESLKTTAAFGGIHIEADNPERTDVAILVMEQDEFGDWDIHPNSIYTSTNEIAHTVRGLDTLKYNFALTVRDRWLNHTDTMYTEVTPLYEMPLSKSRYNAYSLPGDAPRHNSTPMSGLWDGEIFHWPSIYMTQAAHTPSEPHTFTFDIGQMAKLSRIVIWDYPEYVGSGGYDRAYYYLGCPRHFEIWGSNDPPEDGSWDNWHKLGEYEAVKPSGLPYGQQNDEDYTTANAGVSWDFDINAPRVRYLRFKSLQNWGGTTNIGIAEVQVYGDPR